MSALGEALVASALRYQSAETVKYGVKVIVTNSGMPAEFGIAAL